MGPDKWHWPTIQPWLQVYEDAILNVQKQRTAPSERKQFLPIVYVCGPYRCSCSTFDNRLFVLNIRLQCVPHQEKKKSFIVLETVRWASTIIKLQENHCAWPCSRLFFFRSFPFSLQHSKINCYLPLIWYGCSLVSQLQFESEVFFST